MINGMALSAGTPRADIHRLGWVWPYLLALAWLLLVAPNIHAQTVSVPCSVVGNAVSISIPNVSISPSSPNNSLIGSPGTATASFSCPNSGANNTNAWYYVYSNGVLSVWSPGFWPWSPPNPLPSITLQPAPLNNPLTTTIGGQSGYLYGTNLPGIAVFLSWPSPNNGTYGGLTTINATTTGTTVTFTAQLVKTGTVTAGTVNMPSQLLNFTNYSYGYTNSATPSYGSLNLNSVTVTVAACSVNAASQNMTVTLPTVSASALGSVGATAGRTLFNIGLSCAINGTPVYVTMATSNAQPNINGVIAPTSGSGYATNVGVQILNGQSTPISFGTAQNVGNSTSTMTIPYYAQYYETAAPVSSGKVSATVTFTLSYQ